ncbi:MAG: hypothetical protein PWP43_554, partial [Bacillota bacterium]|nr:hypothetical protein [Bacillota bacterium]
MITLLFSNYFLEDAQIIAAHDSRYFRFTKPTL